MSFQTPTTTGLRVLDEGLTVVNPANSMDFVGAGVAATDGGNGKASVSISGGGAAGTQVYSETPTDNGDGTYTLAHTPLAGTLTAYRNGARQKVGAGNDYTLSGAIITSLLPYDATNIFLADYQY